jgi:hypothetical protein
VARITRRFVARGPDHSKIARVAPFMPSAAEIAQCKWLTEAEVEVEVEVMYATEYVGGARVW